MYKQSICPYCNKPFYENLRIHVLEQSGTYTLSQINACEIVTEEELAQSIIHELAGNVYDGITTAELCKILDRQFGLASKYCCDLIQRIKLELDMYSPDRQHLYYVEQPA